MEAFEPSTFCITSKTPPTQPWVEMHTPTILALYHHCSYLKEDVNSEKEAQPVSLAGIGSSVLHTSDPTESRLVPCAVSMGTSKLADQFGARKPTSKFIRNQFEEYKCTYA